jgi:hypothetical protein
MPQQEVFFEQAAGNSNIAVLKTYDKQFAREAFDSMDETAQAFLWSSLKPEEIYDPAGLPTTAEPEDRAAFLWDEVVEQAREDWKTLSFFVVNEGPLQNQQAVYVSPDWPSAEAFAKARLAAIQ